MTLLGSTFAGNSATAGGAIFNAPLPQFPTYSRTWLSNTIVADGPSGDNCAGGDIIDRGHNLQWPDTACGVTIPSLDPLLDQEGLKDNGGPTQTIGLLPGSPAINAGDCAVNGLDQRGYVRPGTGAANCSIGAYEFNSPGPPPLCAGDCRVDGQVTIDELLTIVNIALGNAEMSECEVGDDNDDGLITVDEILMAVNVALNGCGNG